MNYSRYITTCGCIYLYTSINNDNSIRCAHGKNRVVHIQGKCTVHLDPTEFSGHHYNVVKSEEFIKSDVLYILSSIDSKISPKIIFYLLVLYE